MTNTTDESTALGMYDSGFVRKSRTIATHTAVVSCATWLRPPALSTIAVFVGLPLTTNVPETPADRLAALRPTRSTFSSKRSPNFAA